MNLSDHFTLAEMVVSQDAARFGIDNTPDDAQIDNLRRLCRVLETVRATLQSPIIVSSGFRSKELNRIVRGRRRSAHLQGLAADIIVPAYGNPLAVCRAIERSGIPYDQVIHEFGGWCHFGIAAKGDGRRQSLTIDQIGTRSGLLPARS